MNETILIISIALLLIQLSNYVHQLARKQWMDNRYRMWGLNTGLLKFKATEDIKKGERIRISHDGTIEKS